MTLDDLLSRLDGVRPRGAGRYSARCPAHADRSPSLSIAQGDRGVLVKDWAGCSLENICAALGIKQADLFYDAALPRGQRPAPRPARIDRVALAFWYELGALDLRLRAEKIVEAATGIDIAVLSETELDRALHHVGQAYADQERAELFEHVADTLRERDFTEKEHHGRLTRIDRARRARIA